MTSIQKKVLLTNSTLLCLLTSSFVYTAFDLIQVVLCTLLSILAQKIKKIRLEKRYGSESTMGRKEPNRDNGTGGRVE